MTLKENIIKTNFTAKKAFFAGINAPVLSGAYKRAYTRRIKGRLKNFRYPPAISIEPYNVCNLKCIMCPYRNMTRPKTLMNMELFKKIIDNAARLGIGEVSLTFYNEPLIDPHLFERINYAKSRGMRVLFYSNATILNDDKIRKILDNPPDAIRFSFDGATKEVYEKIRRGANFDLAKGNILKLVEERKRLKLNKPRIEINFTIQKDNFKEAKDFESFWKKNVDYVDFGIFDNRVEDDLIGDMHVRAPKNFYPCRRLWRELTVMSSGKVALCCVDFDGSTVVGDLNLQTIEEVWNSPKFAAIRDYHLKGEGNKISLCKTCDHLGRQSMYSWWQ